MGSRARLCIPCLHLAIIATGAATGIATYCMPSDPCWPPASAWVGLNASTNGRLIAVQPEAAVCYSQGPSSPGCQLVLVQWTNATWRAAQPGAMQAPNWEEDASGGSCYNPDLPCTQGSIPPVGIAVQAESDVAAALAFAQQYNIRVVVKSTGHDFQGRSTAAGALLIWMHTFRSVTVNPAFSACAGSPPGAAVTAAAGTPWGDVYAAVAPQYEVVGGSAYTVSAAGGYTLGGGHSFASPAYGLAVDNVLQFTVVLANGSLVTASSCSHPDLFWALRGGGGGTFAVVTTATYVLHPTPPSGSSGLTLQVSLLQGAASVSLLLDGFLQATPSLLSSNTTGVVAGGYFYVLGGGTQFFAVFGFNGTVPAAEATMQSSVVFLYSYPQHFNVTTLTFFPAASLIEWHSIIDQGDATGSAVALGSRLVPISACLDPTQRSNAVNALTYLAGLTNLLGHLVVGGAVSQRDPGSVETSITPAFRKAVWHLAIAASWPTNATMAQQNETFAQISDGTQLLRAVFPDSGAYWSESDYFEPQWQDAFWGASNYARLQSIKAVYDPQGVFTCHHCVELPAAS